MGTLLVVLVSGSPLVQIQVQPNERLRGEAGVVEEDRVLGDAHLERVPPQVDAPLVLQGVRVCSAAVHQPEQHVLVVHAKDSLAHLKNELNHIQKIILKQTK